MDSDGDGRTNGEELDDISCGWKRHDDDVPVYHGKRFTHPGVTNEGKWPEERSDDEEILSMETDPYLDMDDEDEDEEEWDGQEEED